jgi:tRNA (cmo5U34)-methyltransferase
MLVEMTKAEGARVLDLGCGTGILSEFVLTRSPSASMTLFDQSADMLEVATNRLHQYAVTTAQGSFDDYLPTGPFDAVISALAIHHLSDEMKAGLICRVTGILADGGVFINADQVAGTSPWHDDVYRAMHEKQSRELGTSDAEWSAAVQRMSIDLYATIDWHLARFDEAGLSRCDTFFKRFGFAVMAGWKDPA